MREFKLSPSDFAFLWEQCKRCFYLKVVHGIRQPSMPMAGIFKRIEVLQMGFFDGKPTSEVSADLPPGIIRCGEKMVESEVIAHPNGEVGAYIYGKIDSLIEFDDRSWGVLDFKTTERKSDHVPLYGRQLHSYAYSFEHPSQKPRRLKKAPPSLSPISRLGLLCFEPTAIHQPGVGRHSYDGEVTWIPIERDDQEFLAFVQEILGVLAGPLPGPTEGCDWCAYAARMASGSISPAATTATGAHPMCPKCGGPMVQRNGKNGPFLGCARFPDCKGTRNI